MNLRSYQTACIEAVNDLWEPYINESAMWAKEFRQQEGAKVRFIKGDICDLSRLVEENSVDFIGCNAMIDLLCAKDRALFYREAFRVLRVGGVLSVNRIYLKAGYSHDWEAYTERRAILANGFEMLNDGWHNAIITRKPYGDS